ncbi:MAG: NUDIX hydrolase [Nanoarchaeota archaeon]
MEPKYNQEDLIDHHGVSAIIKDDKGKILMQEHVKYGFWTIPVGKVMQNQDVKEGLKQEVFEECNIKVLECKEIFYKLYEYIRNGKNVKVYTHLFEITKYSGEVKNKEPHKHKKQLFMEIKDIMKLPYLSDTSLLYLETIGLKRSSHLVQS